MSRKSAASVKPKPIEKTAEEKEALLRKSFDENKWAFEETVKTQVQTSTRFDNYANLRDLALRVLDKDAVNISLVKDLMHESTRSYDLVLDRVRRFDYEKFVGDEPYDYFSDIMPDPEQIEDDMDFLYAVVRFMSVKPYGDKMLQMWQTLRQQKQELGL